MTTKLKTCIVFFAMACCGTLFAQEHLAESKSLAGMWRQFVIRKTPQGEFVKIKSGNYKVMNPDGTFYAFVTWGTGKDYDPDTDITSMNMYGTYTVTSDSTFTEHIVRHSANSAMNNSDSDLKYKFLPQSDNNLMVMEYKNSAINRWIPEMWERVIMSGKPGGKSQSFTSYIAKDLDESASFTAPNYEEIEKNIQNEKSNLFYPKLMKRYLDSDTTLNLDEKRHLYYGYVFHENYSPYKISEYLDSARFLARKPNLSEADFQKIIHFTDKVLKDDPFNTNALYDKLFALFSLKDTDSFHKTVKQYEMIVETIVNSGRGRTKDTAFHVIAVPHEYAVLLSLGLALEEQNLIDHYDYMKLKPNKYGIEGFYFDISSSLNFLSKQFGK